MPLRDISSDASVNRDGARGVLPCVILAGGQARRMGGGDKGLTLVAGLPMIAHVIGRVGHGCAPIAINANGDPGRWAAFGLTVLPDDLPEGIPSNPGPLAGVLAALDWAATLRAGQVVIVAADTPFLPADLVDQLARAAGPAGCAIAASRDAAGLWRDHPTCGLWPVSGRAALRVALQVGLRRIGEWARLQAAATVCFDSPAGDPFFNVNTREDVAMANSLAPRSAPEAL